MVAASNGHPECVRALVEGGADKEATGWVRQKNEHVEVFLFCFISCSRIIS